MPDKAEDMLFELAKQQDSVMHNLSGELGVKTSLYLVFAAFVINASIQVVNLSKDAHTPRSHHAILLCAVGAGIALLSGFSLLIAAVVRDNYAIFPANEMAGWLRKIDSYRQANPGKGIDPSSGLMQTLIQTIDQNQAVNARKAMWIQIGTWLLFAALPFTATGGFLAIKGVF